MKKILAILLTLALLVSLIGCTSKVVEEIRTNQTTIGGEVTTTAPEETIPGQTEPTEETLPPQIDQTDPPGFYDPTEPPATEPTVPPTTQPQPTVPPTTQPAPTVPPTTAPEPTVPPTTQPEPTEPPTTQPEPDPEPLLDPDGSYTTKDDVALYLHLYGCLPKNFITKSEAKTYGWKSGSLEKYAPGKCLGGDRFYNKEGLLPDGHTYYECDIDTLGSYKSRGAKRIVYSDDGLIYYTDDHYASFTLLYSNFAVIDLSALLFAAPFVYY